MLICLYPSCGTILATASERACKIVGIPPSTLRYVPLPFVFDPLEAKQHILKITADGSSDILFCTALTMEILFSPCTRLYDILESQGDLQDFRGHFLLEVLQELNLDVSTEDLLSAENAFTYADLYAMLGNEDTMAWLTPHTYLVRADGRAALCSDHVPDCYQITFNVDSQKIDVMATSPEHLLKICDIVVRLLAVSVVHRVILEGLCINATTWAYLMEQCQSLKVLSLVDLDMDENHCRVLGAYSRPDLEIVLDGCEITSAGTSALVEILGRNQGPTKLDCIYIDNFALAKGLRGNSHLKSWRPCISRNPDDGNREVLAIAGALRENKGLVDLDLSYALRVSDVTWGAICDSLKAHPTLEVLDFRATTAPAALKSRMYALLDMMKINVSIRTLRLDRSLTNTSVYRESVIPYLVTNRFRPRVRAIQRTRPIAYRAKVLGRGLLAVRTDPNPFWMLLSKNAEVVFA
jgi:hypothetical protein